MTLSPQNDALRSRSGAVNSQDPLVSFLYILMRDHLPAGVVEGIIQNHVVVEAQDEGPSDESQFCNGYLAAYAKDIAARLVPPAPEERMGTLNEQFNYHRQALTTLFAKIACACGPSTRRLIQDPKAELLVMSFPKLEVTLNLFDSQKSIDPLHVTTMALHEDPETFAKRFIDEIRTGLQPQEKP